MDKSVYIAAPTYRNGSRMEENMLTIVLVRELLQRTGIACDYQALHGRVIETARAELVRGFLASPHSHLLWLDDDLWFNPQIVLRLLRADLPIATVIYPRRDVQPTSYAVDLLPGAEIREAGSEKLLDVHRTVIGCSLMARDAIERVHLANPGLWVDSDITPGAQVNAVWQRVIAPNGRGGQTWLGEDYSFCTRSTAAGVPITAVCDIAITHKGTPGNFLHAYEARIAGGPDAV